MKTQPYIRQQERVDDIPLAIGVLRRLNIANILDKHLGRHHLHQGISSGSLALGWLAYILTQSDHRKAAVQDWARLHQLTLQRLFGCSLRPHEFSDDRLGILLGRLASADWVAIEADLFSSSFSIFQFPTSCFRLDSTSSCGYHCIEPDGIMQLGHSKDHRPDLPQLKIMAGVCQPLAFPLTTTVIAGHRADDELYWPAIVNVKAILQTADTDKDTPLLFCGDRKMASLSIRARISKANDYYLTVLPHTGTTAKLFDSWVGRALRKGKTLTEVYEQEVQGKDPLCAVRGFQFSRKMRFQVDDQQIRWSERVQILQSHSLQQSQKLQLEKRLRQAEDELWALTGPGKGRKVWRQEEELSHEISRLLHSKKVQGLLQVCWEKEEKKKRRKAKAGRPKKGEKIKQEKEVRYRIKEVKRDEKAIREKQRRLGWYAQVTNAPEERLSLEGSVRTYREGSALERPFHQLKDTPLGIRPMFVQKEEQIIGLTKLLLIGLRVLTMLEVMVRSGLETRGEKLEGLYEGQKNRKEDRPTAKRVLKAVAKLELTLSEMIIEQKPYWHLTPLPKLVRQILDLLGLPSSLYTDLTSSLPSPGCSGTCSNEKL